MLPRPSPITTPDVCKATQRSEAISSGRRRDGRKIRPAALRMGMVYQSRTLSYDEVAVVTSECRNGWWSLRLHSTVQSDRLLQKHSPPNCHIVLTSVYQALTVSHWYLSRAPAYEADVSISYF